MILHSALCVLVCWLCLAQHLNLDWAGQVLSEGIVADDRFARQARRKYV